MPTLAPPRPATPAPATPRRITSTPLTPPTPTITPISPTPEPTEEPRPDHRRFAVEALLAGAPLAAYAAEMLAASDAAGIDWRLIPVIGVLESSGGRFACGGNAWGYASCGVSFATFEEGIEVVAGTLARRPYAGLSTEARLCMWVSGGSCGGALAAGYLAKARPMLEELGR